MKRNTVMQRIKLLFSIILICCGSGVFFASCGLDTVLTVEPPIITHNKINYESIEYATYYCGFKTRESENQTLEGGDFIGTEVFYRIYSNVSDLNSHVSAIESLNTNSNGEAAAQKLISLGYQTLGIYPKNDDSTFVGYNSGNDTDVYFRLKSYKNRSSDLPEDLYTMIACIKVGNNYSVSGSEYKVPCRTGVGSSNSWRSFDFFDDEQTRLEQNVKPEQGDIDFQYSSSPTSDKEYYVQLYAVSVALNQQTVSNAYSLVLDLGSIPIREGE